MHLAETALIKKYENDIGGSIVDVGGDVTHDSHWLPFLDNQIENQLVSEGIIDQKLDERGLTPDAIDAWNQVVQDFNNGAVRYDISQFLDEAQKQQARENIGIVQSELDAWNQTVQDVAEIMELPAIDITQNDIDAWNQVVQDFNNGAVRYDVAQNLTESQQQQARENIDIQTTYDAARWDNNE